MTRVVNLGRSPRLERFRAEPSKQAKHHEQARPARARKLQQPSMQRPGQPQTNAPPAIGSIPQDAHGRAEIDLIRKPSKLAGPDDSWRDIALSPSSSDPKTACCHSVSASSRPVSSTGPSRRRPRSGRR